MVKSIVNKRTQFVVGVKQSSNAIFHDCIRRFFESIQKKCCELSLVNSESTSNKQANDNKVDSQLTTHNSLVKAIAFTLAETLVVMGIIGVVAALTIPNLNQSTGDREKVAKVKKIYADLEDAFGRATAVYGNTDTWCTNLPNNVTCSQRVADRLKEFMKVSKDCGTSYGCFSQSPLYTFDGSMYAQDYASDLGNSGAVMFTLADGTSIAVYNFSTSNRVSWDTYLFVDIDGPTKGKTQDGVDIFDFLIEEDGIYPNGHQFISQGSAAVGDWNDDYSWFPTLWVVLNENLDYLKCEDELNWTTKTSCK